MPAPTNISTDLGRVISRDAVEQFGLSVRNIQGILENVEVVPMQSGKLIRLYSTKITEPDGTREPGEDIPLTEVEFVEDESLELQLKHDRVAVTDQALQDYGKKEVKNAKKRIIAKTQKEVLDSLFEGLAKGTGKASGKNFQSSLAKATGQAVTKFEDDNPDIVSFVNTNDAFSWLAEFNITTQSAFGLNYVKDVLNNKAIIMSSRVPEGTIYTTAVNNLQMYHVDMTGGEVASMFDLETDNTGYLGVKHYVDQRSKTIEMTVSHGIIFTPEVKDGVIVAEVTGDTP